jgi:hypothetical protein
MRFKRMGYSIRLKYLCIIVVIYLSTTTLAHSSVNEVIINGTVGAGKHQITVDSNEAGSAVIEPQTITIDSKGNVYIDDPGKMRIIKFNSAGEHILDIKRDLDYAGKEPSFNDLIYDSSITDISLDKDDNVYVLSQNLKRIEKYSPKGKLFKYISLNNLIKESINTNGISIRRLKRMHIDNFGSIYIKNSEKMLFKINDNGEVRGIWNTKDGFITPSFYIDLSGNLFILKKDNAEKYDSNGKPVSTGKCTEIIPFNPKCLDVWRAFEGGYILADGYYTEFGNIIANFLIVDNDGNEIGRFRDPLMFGYSPLGSRGSNVKFDKYGNYYNLLVHYKKKYWVEKYDIEKMLNKKTDIALEVFLHMDYKGKSIEYDINSIDFKVRGNFVLDVHERAQRKFVRLLRNEIFARHGRTFKSKDLRQIFESTDWYKPDPNYSDDMLNDIEKKNIQFILDYEKKMGWR